MKKNSIKILIVAPLAALTMGSCKTISTYTNTVSMVKNNKVLMKDPTSGEERLVDCSKKTATYPNLLKDLPYFREGDTIEFIPAEGYTYEGFRAYNIEGSTFNYNKDSIQIRKDLEKIEQFKKDSVQRTR